MGKGKGWLVEKCVVEGGRMCMHLCLACKLRLSQLTVVLAMRGGFPSLEPEIFKESLLEAGSCSLKEFRVQFNVDILSPQVDHADEEVGWWSVVGLLEGLLY